MEWKEKLKGCLKNGKKTCKNNQCRKNCECYESWVAQKKKEEWTNIKKHFYTQDFGEGKLLGEIPRYYVIETVLEDEYFDGISDAYADPQHMEKISKTLEEKKKKRVADASNEETIIDYLLDHEKEEAEKCKKCEDPTKPGGGGGGGAPGDVGRSATFTPDIPKPPADSEDGNAENEEEEEEDEDEEEEEDDANEENVGEEPEAEGDSATTEVTVEDGKGESAKETTKEVNPCDIVSKLFSGNDFGDACTLKYNKGKNYGWKCVPTEKTNAAASEGGGERAGAPRQRRSADRAPSGTNQGSICVPPRRRRLYVGKLHDWAEKYNKVGNTATQPPPDSAASPSNLRDGLRDAFIQSAAVETFFLWHKYKEEKKPQGGGSLLLQTINRTLENSDDPQTLLQKGEIPPDFLRLMFYTLADYKDILYSGGTSDSGSGSKDNTNNDKTNIVLLASENKQEMKQIQQKIDEIIKQSGTSGGTPPGKPSAQTPDKWWNDNGQHIWHGMICALTYEEKTSGSGEKGTQQITQDEKVKGALLEADGNKPKNNYQYSSVTIGASGAKPKSNDDITTPTLTQFVERPPYFRYLEEWGQNFCKERKKRLAQIKVDCEVEENNGRRGGKKCSAYGEQCEKIRNQDYSTVRNFFCPRCGKHCSSYRKWIGRKKDEFTEQQNAYGEQQGKCQSKSGGGVNGVCGKLEENAATFLQKLGPCSKNNNTEEDKIEFDKPDNTFKPATNCGPCSLIGAKCKNGSCRGSNGTTGNCNGGKINAKNIGNGVNSTDINMLVSDNSATGFAGDLENHCKNADIFKGIKEDKWKCGTVCGVDICKLENVNGGTDGKEYIQIRALARRWVEYFLEDYNKIKHKISHCIDNGKGNICKNKCNDKCKCVGEWINKKRTEWKTIRKRYFEQYKVAEPDMKSLVTNFLEDVQSQIDFNKAIKPCGTLQEFESFCGLNDAEKSKTKDGDKRDLVLCMITKLETKIKTCEEKHPQTSGDQGKCQNPMTPPDDEDLLLEEENTENTVEAKKNMMPTFCNIDEPKETEEEGEKCEPADEKKNKEKEKGVKADEEKNEGETSSDTLPEPAPAPVLPVPSAPAQPEDSGKEIPVVKPEEEQPSTEEAPNKEETPPQLQSDEPSKPIGDILSSTIPFGIAIALTSIVFLFLK
ncbi:hypothetical protein PFMC_05930, partial [Plasmodium falciparum CAMP/Malaysia]